MWISIIFINLLQFENQNKIKNVENFKHMYIKIVSEHVLGIIYEFLNYTIIILNIKNFV